MQKGAYEAEYSRAVLRRKAEVERKHGGEGMKHMINFVIKNWMSLTVGFLLTDAAFKSAYAWRGYYAIGGEWFVFPLTVFVLKGAKRFIENLVDM